MLVTLDTVSLRGADGDPIDDMHDYVHTVMQLRGKGK